MAAVSFLTYAADIIPVRVVILAAARKMCAHIQNTNNLVVFVFCTAFRRGDTPYYSAADSSLSVYVALATRLNCGLPWRFRRIVVSFTKRLLST